MRGFTAEEIKNGGCKSCTLPKARKKAAAKRILKAEGLLYRVVEMLRKAQGELSVIVGLNKNYPKIGDILEKVKEQIYDLERCRESGRCEMDR